jgi:hypothetical protein
MGREGCCLFGLVEWAEGGAPRRAEEIAVARVGFLRVRLIRGRRTPAFLLRRRADAAASALARRGVTRAVFPAEFPFLERFARRGVLPVETLGLYRQLAASLALAALAERGVPPAEAAAAVTALHLTGEVRRAVTELSLRCRYVLLAANGEGADFCRGLRREYGVSLQLTPSRRQLDQAEVRVDFAPGQGPAAGQSLVALWEGGPPLPPLRWEGGPPLPEGPSRPQLLAALWRGGAMEAGDLTPQTPVPAPAEGTKGAAGTP